LYVLNTIVIPTNGSYLFCFHKDEQKLGVRVFVQSQNFIIHTLIYLAFAYNDYYF